MTEGEWLASSDPQRMLDSLRTGMPTPGGYDMGHGLPTLAPRVAPPASDRKLRLFACACCRAVWELLPEESRQAVKIAERYADGLAANKEWQAAGAGDYGGPWNPSAPGWSCCLAEGSLAARQFVMKNFLRCQQRPDDKTQGSLLRCIFGNPFRPVTIDPAWLTPTVTALATAIYQGEERECPECRGRGKVMDSGPYGYDKTYTRCSYCGGSGCVSTGFRADDLPYLADALEDAGCCDQQILDHLRGPGPHCRGCFCVDLILGKS